MSATGASLAPALSALRESIHILAATIWVGGQITITSLLSTVRKLGDGAPRAVAKAFGKLQWPTFFILIATGIWNAVSDDPRKATGTWKTVLIVECFVALAAGLSAWLHQRARSRAGLAAFGSLAGILSLVALVIGVLLAG